MKLAALQALIAAGESQTLEFKASFDKACIATLVAFANAQGGTVLVGVSDGGFCTWHYRGQRDFCTKAARVAR